MAEHSQDDRDAKIAEINSLNEEIVKMKEELQVHAENDPAILDAMGPWPLFFFSSL